MCLKPSSLAPIPDDTRQLGEILLSPQDPFRLLGEKIADFVCDADFAALYPNNGQPALSPALMAMVTVFQAKEKLSDRQAVRMLVRRVDWKYALHLPLSYGGFDHSVLCEFRDRLVESEQQALVFDQLLGRLRELGLMRSGGKQRTDSFSVLSAVRQLNRLELVWETLRVALSALEKADLEWLREAVPLSWGDRYGQRGEQFRLVREEGEEGKRKSRELALQVGRDGLHLLGRLAAEGTPEALRALPEVAVLEQVWEQQYVRRESVLEWPERAVVPGAEVICTPHDPQVRYSSKRGEGWEGSKVHVTETVDSDLPHLVTDIQTTAATTPDFGQAEVVQQTLAEKGLLPGEHYVDSGYVTGDALAASAEREVELVGPARADSSAQSRLEGGLTADQFQVDEEKRQVRCPAGETSTQYYERQEEGRVVTHVEFSGATCAACSLRARCVNSQREDAGRTLTLRPHHELVRARRVEQQTEAFKANFNTRAGVEGTLSEMSRAHGLRQARYRGLAKTYLQHLMIAVATNLKRVARWWAGEKRAGTRGLGLRGLAAGAGA